MLKTGTPNRREEAALFRRRALTITVAAMVLVFIVWNIPGLNFILYPFRLFVTYVHEASHGLMAVLTGGQIAGFTISADGSGLASTIGGIRALILPAGYLGAALFGALLFYTINTVRYSRFISMALGLAFVLFSVMFARPDQSGAPTALLVGFLFGMALIGMGWRANQTVNLLVLNIMAMITGLNAVLDLFYLTGNANIIAQGDSGPIRNDAAAFSAEIMPLVPPVVWAVLWAGLALLMLGAAIYLSIFRPMRRNR
jgi:hypothetical protein